MKARTHNNILKMITVIASAIVAGETICWPFTGWEFLPVPAFAALAVSLIWIGLFATVNIDWEGSR